MYSSQINAKRNNWKIKVRNK